MREWELWKENSSGEKQIGGVIKKPPPSQTICVDRADEKWGLQYEERSLARKKGGGGWLGWVTKKLCIPGSFWKEVEFEGREGRRKSVREGADPPMGGKKRSLYIGERGGRKRAEDREGAKTEEGGEEGSWGTTEEIGYWYKRRHYNWRVNQRRLKDKGEKWMVNETVKGKSDRAGHSRYFKWTNTLSVRQEDEGNKKEE